MPSWVTPITDRTELDILGRTAKAFLNVADWVRIDGNTQVVRDEINTILAMSVTITPLTAPVITDFPDVADINTLIENIDILRVAACLPVGTGIVSLKHDYQAGPGAVAPYYEDVNDWEGDLLLLHTLLPYAADYFVRCGVANCGQARFWQARFR